MSGLIRSSYNFNKFYTSVLYSSSEFRLCLSLCLSISLIPIVLLFFYLLNFCSNAFFQIKILFLINHNRKLMITTIRIYQCFRFFFFLLFNMLLTKKAIFLCLFFPSHRFQKHFDNSISDRKH